MIENINCIQQLFKKFVSDSKFKNIDLDVDVVEIKSYKSMTFMKVSDQSGTIKAICYRPISDIVIGNKIKIKCSVCLYQTDIQLNILNYEHIGVSEQNKNLDILTKELDLLGYFKNKPELTYDYEHIAIISSTDSAGLKDFLFTINKRCQNKKLYIYPATVQGSAAEKEVSGAINLANKHSICQIIVLIRGGGSKTDLECFNSRMIADSIFNSKIPIVTGIGHQIDLSIADMVASKSFITPTEVGQRITKENIYTKDHVNNLIGQIKNKIIEKMDNQYDYINYYQNKLTKYYSELDTYLNTIKYDKINVADSMNNYYDYITGSENDLKIYERNYIADLEKLVIESDNKIKSSLSMFNHFIILSETKIKQMAQPKIVSTSTEIKLLSDLKKNSEYKIIFMDGVYILKT